MACVEIKYKIYKRKFCFKTVHSVTTPGLRVFSLCNAFTSQENCRQYREHLTRAQRSLAAQKSLHSHSATKLHVLGLCVPRVVPASSTTNEPLGDSSLLVAAQLCVFKSK